MTRKLHGLLPAAEVVGIAVGQGEEREAADLADRVSGSEGGEQDMPRIVDKPAIITAAGNKPKIIEEYIGRVNSNTGSVSIARMKSPQGWLEPGQRPEFTEYSVVLKGTLRVTSSDGTFLDVLAGQAVIAPAGEWVQYGTPRRGGAEYVAVCLPAFSPDTVHRDG